MNLERSFNKLDVVLSIVTDSTNACMYTMIEEFLAFQVSIAKKDEEIARPGNKLKVLKEMKIDLILAAMEKKETENQELLRKVQAVTNKKTGMVVRQVEQVMQKPLDITCTEIQLI